MNVQVVQKVCYLEEAGSNRDIPPGYQAMDVPSTAKPGRLAGWLRGQPGKKRIVYRPAIRLSLDDLEVVSFVPGGASLGTWCWCDVFLRIEDPLALLGERGQQQADGRWLVTEELLAAWYRTRLVAALAHAGAHFDLRSEACWPEILSDLVRQLARDCPAGVAWDNSPVRTHACLLRRVRSYDEYLEEVTLKEEFRQRLEQIQRDGSLIRAAEQGRLDKLLKELGEDRVAGLLTPAERAGSAGDRVTSYREVLGTASGTQLAPGVVIGNFRLLSQLGQGGQGQVWKAHDTKGDRFVVLKLVPPEVQNAADEMSRLKTTFSRIHALHHQNICPVYGLDEDRRFGWYLVMKHVDGQTLRTYRATYVAWHGSFPLEQVVKVLRPVAEALDYAHARKVMHRDIKPENILVVGDAEEVELVDFGLAAEIHTSISRVSLIQMEISGTRPYMAPEQWRGEYQDRTTDQYSLAVVAYELLAGHLPFDSEDFDILRACVLNEPPKPIEGQAESVNRALLVGLGKQRAERLESCIAFLRAMEGEELTARPVAPSRPKAKARSPEREPAPAPTPALKLFSVIENSMGMKLTLIPPGEFVMGSSLSAAEIHRRFPGGDVERYEVEHPPHKVRITRPYYLGTHQVTVGDFERFVTATGHKTTAEKEGNAWGYKDGKWQEVKGLNWRKPGFDQQSTHPVTCVSWDDAVAFCRWLSGKESRTYRLPTEAEWEYACRAGTNTLFFWGDDPDAGEGYLNAADQTGTPDGRSWKYKFNFKSGYTATSPVGKFKPNAFGLHDMLGNVWEWCSDWFDPGYYANSPMDDPTGAPAGSLRVLRGGSWGIHARNCRSASRSRLTPGNRRHDLGFRVASSSVDASGS